ncbi:hypothetical protein DFH08DRAFT_974029 [Mycena albidolilacea]|uniref:Uncharacterized protein n=1 Tax=Mycena albidolilacea TaxID=1033008 RepID=A0AAD6Z8N1_9AGAR|nr:hypothetical protein DFH08DRAFT_974029 [Mycena albidolilacea]
MIFIITIFDLVYIPSLVLLFFSLVFRLATVVKTKELLLAQRLAFLGGCTQTNPPYTPQSILLNRSLARPLVRGESKYIIFARAFILSCIALGVPAFGIFATVIRPISSAVSTRNIVKPTWPEDHSGPGNVSVSFSSGFGQQVSATLRGSSQKISCPKSEGSFTCSFAWFEIDDVSISVSFPSNVNQVVQVHLQCTSEVCDDSGIPIPLLPGSRLFGLPTWSKHQLVSEPGFPSSFVYNPEVHALQPQPSTAATDLTIASLILNLPFTGPNKFVQDVADVTPLSGIATFGGFWTFLNGTFALFFGANVVYFLFGKRDCQRPLSALGVVHLLQRRALVRRWHEDFPAIYTEGGLPGSESAGIVAFVRERLVDLSEDPRESGQHPNDIEAQELSDEKHNDPRN